MLLASESLMPLYLCASFVIQLREPLLKVLVLFVKYYLPAEVEHDRCLVHGFFMSSPRVLKLDAGNFILIQ